MLETTTLFGRLLCVECTGINTVCLIDSWARYVAERNPSVGKLLTRGVRAFRNHNW